MRPRSCPPKRNRQLSCWRGLPIGLPNGHGMRRRRSSCRRSLGTSRPVAPPPPAGVGGGRGVGPAPQRQPAWQPQHRAPMRRAHPLGLPVPFAGDGERSLPHARRPKHWAEDRSRAGPASRGAHNAWLLRTGRSHVPHVRQRTAGPGPPPARTGASARRDHRASRTARPVPADLASGARTGPHPAERRRWRKDPMHREDASCPDSNCR
jgi:hypothetical protein